MQSFANTNSLPIELGPGISWIEGWTCPRFAWPLDLFKGYSRFLRYPGPGQGAGYRLMRAAVITVLRVRALF